MRALEGRVIMSEFMDDGAEATPAELFHRFLDQRGDGLDARLHAALRTPGTVSGPARPIEGISDNVITVDFRNPNRPALTRRTGTSGSGTK